MQTATATAPPSAPAASYPVKIVGGPREWALLPPTWRSYVWKEMVARVSRIRAQIGIAAGLVAPNLDIVPWGRPPSAAGDVVFVRAAAAWRVELTAAAALVEDDAVMRLLIVQGFLDCVQLCCRAAKKGCGAASLWVGAADAANIAERARFAGRLADAADLYGRSWLAKCLPVKVPCDPIVDLSEVPYSILKRLESLDE